MYEALPPGNFVRLLQLEPGTYSDPIRCTLEVVSITDVVDKYEAMSYVWGDPTITEEIICNETPVQVIANLVDALRAIRSTEKRRTLWADAICINQQDLDERSSQVKIMDQIYSQAQAVISWLGPDLDGDAKGCFDLIIEVNEHLAKTFERHMDSWSDLPPIPCQDLICHDRERWVQVEKLLQFPYFSRVWIVQEVALAKKCELFWGPTHICVAQLFEFAFWSLQCSDLIFVISRLGLPIQKDLNILRDLILSLYSLFTLKGSWRNLSPLLKRLSQVASKGESPLCYMFDSAGGLGATDPRDHIFALLGTAYTRTPAGHPFIEPDYRLSVEDVYFRTACALLKVEREGFQLFDFVRRKNRASLMHGRPPSWIPFWHIEWKETSRISNRGGDCRAGGPMRALNACVDHELRTLQVLGSVCDKIGWLSVEMKYGDLRLNPRYWSKATRMSGKSTIDAIWEQLSTFKTVNEEDFELTLAMGAWDSQRERISEYRKRLRGMAQEPDDENAALAAERDPELYETETSFVLCKGRCLAVTENGHLAMVPSSTRVGDACCVVLGSNLPMILAVDGEQRYRLVGTAYIRGYMEGEIAKEIEEGLREEETITIW